MKLNFCKRVFLLQYLPLFQRSERVFRINLVFMSTLWYRRPFFIIFNPTTVVIKKNFRRLEVFTISKKGDDIGFLSNEITFFPSSMPKNHPSPFLKDSERLRNL